MQKIISKVLNPDFLEESIKGRKNAWKRFGSSFLRVTFKKEGEIATVITAVVKDKLPERLGKK